MATDEASTHLWRLSDQLPRWHLTVIPDDNTVGSVHHHNALSISLYLQAQFYAQHITDRVA